jgi:hypothetical protein
MKAPPGCGIRQMIYLSRSYAFLASKDPNQQQACPGLSPRIQDRSSVVRVRPHLARVGSETWMNRTLLVECLKYIGAWVALVTCSILLWLGLIYGVAFVLGAM